MVASCDPLDIVNELDWFKNNETFIFLDDKKFKTTIYFLTFDQVWSKHLIRKSINEMR